VLFSIWLQENKKGPAKIANPFQLLAGQGRIELPTPGFSVKAFKFPDLLERLKFL
jgi:hypothetical protein